MATTHRAHRSVCPLATYWPYGRRFRGWRISTLPTPFIASALENLPRLPDYVRCALVAESSLRVMSNDQREGR